MAVAVTTNITGTPATQQPLREDLSDIISIIDPTETPVTANIGMIDVDNPEGHEHQIEDLAAVSTAGVVDGVVFEDLTTSARERDRLLARCQIQAKAIKISGRREASDKAGVDSELAHQLALRSEEMQRDAEAVICAETTPVASAPPVAPLTAGIPTWIRTNTVLGASGAPAAPTLPGKEPVAGAAASANDAMDESLFLDLLGTAYNAGANPDGVFVYPTQKQKISQYMFGGSARIATAYQDHGKSPSGGLQVVGAVDYYVSDFGVLSIVPSRFQRSTDVLILDTSLWERGTFRGYELIEIAKAGDFESAMLLHDFCLVSRNEKGSAIMRDRDPTAAMVA